MTGFEIKPFHATDLDWLVDRHAALYRAADGFDDTFGPLVRSIAQDFIDAHDPGCEAGWIGWTQERRVGSIFCTRGAAADVAQLRLFLLEPEMRGQGAGQRLLRTCLRFAKGAGYKRITLWTHESHHAACRLYARSGFRRMTSRPVRSFGQNLVEQSWTFDLARLAIEATGR